MLEPNVWGGIDCTRNLQVHYYSTIYGRCRSCSVDRFYYSVEIRAFIRTFKEDAAEALGLQENSDRVEVLDESKVVQTIKGLDFFYGMSQVFVHESRRKEAKRNNVVRLSQQAVEADSDNLFQKSTRNLVAVTTSPTINFNPSELAFSLTGNNR